MFTAIIQILQVPLFYPSPATTDRPSSRRLAPPSFVSPAPSALCPLPRLPSLFNPARLSPYVEAYSPLPLSSMIIERYLEK
ncbi:hypothetical protein H6F86_29570 [Phormidium sp. FACHB-592]|uniref:Uncharacterized protein n=1 Tax=Stenomitos frigidus AS-A4 TaxID=2933935 RepID=A0ABV0KFX5_9CYAN|nr:hypothetical protein [Phormidium sp. FACHB-592]MBD2077964.1 hypothetical protein [Phormidium sp. FACHB-592]